MLIASDLRTAAPVQLRGDGNDVSICSSEWSKEAAATLWRYFVALGAALISIAPNSATQMYHASSSSAAGARVTQTMRKAILLDVTVDVQLWVEGTDAAPHDYAASSVQAVRRMIRQGADSEHRLHVVIRDIHEHAEP